MQKRLKIQRSDLFKYNFLFSTMEFYKDFIMLFIEFDVFMYTYIEYSVHCYKPLSIKCAGFNNISLLTTRCFIIQI